MTPTAPDPSIAGQPDWQSLPSPVLVLGAAGDATAINRAFSDFTGLSTAAAGGSGWHSVVSPESLEPLLAALAARRDFRLQIALQRVAGGAGQAWVDVSARWLPVGERYLAQLHDVSAVRMAEAGAREQARQFRLVADNVPALIAALSTPATTAASSPTQATPARSA